jgi:hypothetical protein
MTAHLMKVVTANIAVSSTICGFIVISAPHDFGRRPGKTDTRGKMDISCSDKTKARICPCLLLLRKTHS